MDSTRSGLANDLLDGLPASPEEKAEEQTYVCITGGAMIPPTTDMANLTT